MPDIAKCKGSGCDIKQRCKRYKSTPEPMQWFAQFDQTPKPCQYYKEVERKEPIERNTKHPATIPPSFE